MNGAPACVLSYPLCVWEQGPGNVQIGGDDEEMERCWMRGKVMADGTVPSSASHVRSLPPGHPPGLYPPP